MPGKLYEVNRSRRETKIQFDVHLVGRHKELVKLMTTTLAGILKTRNLSPSNNATLRNYSVAVGGYRSSVGGFQRSIFALESGNPNVGTRRPHEGGSYGQD